MCTVRPWPLSITTVQGAISTAINVPDSQVGVRSVRCGNVVYTQQQWGTASSGRRMLLAALARMLQQADAGERLSDRQGACQAVSQPCRNGACAQPAQTRALAWQTPHMHAVRRRQVRSRHCPSVLSTGTLADSGCHLAGTAHLAAADLRKCSRPMLQAPALSRYP